MKVLYTPAIEEWDEGKRLAQSASERLVEVLGSSGQKVTAEWDKTHDEQGRNRIALTLKDFPGEVSSRFAPDELRNEPVLRIRLYRLRGDLLKQLNEVQHDKLKALVREQEAS